MGRRFGVGSGTLALSVALVAGACESATGPEGAASVSVAFRAGMTGATSLRVPSGERGLAASAAPRVVELVGSNGTLSLDEIWFIVSELELERVDSACPTAGETVAGGDDEDDDDDDECEEFEAPPSFVQLPLDGTGAPAVTRPVAAGVYESLEFEVEDIEPDDDEDGDEVQTLFDEVRAAFPDWPEEASMLATGSFTPTAEAPVPFRVFFEAEIEIEREFEPPLDLTAGEDATVTVVVDPAVLFLRLDGTVLDLSRFDGQVVEFEVEMEDGFTGIELDDHDGDDD